MDTGSCKILFSEHIYLLNLAQVEKECLYVRGNEIRIKSFMPAEKFLSYRSRQNYIITTIYWYI